MERPVKLRGIREVDAKERLHLVNHRLCQIQGKGVVTARRAISCRFLVRSNPFVRSNHGSRL